MPAKSGNIIKNGMEYIVIDKIGKELNVINNNR